LRIRLTLNFRQFRYPNSVRFYQDAQHITALNGMMLVRITG
jgi:hypothetical protein